MILFVSSRTPEGEPQRCPVCASEFRIEPSLPLGDAPCPACGALLWFFRRGDELHLLPPEQAALARKKVVQFIAAHLNIAPEKVGKDLIGTLQNEFDSIDVVELVMEMEEEEFDIG